MSSTHPSQLSCFLYHSEMAPAADLTCVADIIKTARVFNKRHGITGMLVFDGLRFCQYIEGPSPALQQLIVGLFKDPRHIHVTAQLHTPLGGARQFPNWSMAYLWVDDEEPLTAVTGLTGMAAIQKFCELMPLLDLE